MLFLIASYITIFEISATSSSAKVSFEEIAHITITDGIVLDCEVNLDTLFIMTVAQGLITCNVSDVQHPEQLASAQETCYAHHFDIQGNRYYLADNAFGVKIFDITNPSNLVKLGQYLPEGDGEIVGVHAKEDYLYVTEWHDSTWSYKMLVLDISNSSNPVKIAEYEDGDNSFIRFQTEDDLCFVACYTHGFKILNISNPLEITEISHYSDMDNAFNFQIVDNKAFITDSSNFQIIDIEDITTPTKLGEHSTTNHVMDVEIKDSIAFISEREAGLIALDISNPQTPIKIAKIDENDMFGIDLDDQYLYASLVDYGLKIYSYEILQFSTSNAALPLFFIFVLLGAIVHIKKINFFKDKIC